MNNIYNDPTRIKRVVIIISSVLSIFIVAVAVLGYLYYEKNKSNQVLLTDKTNLENDKNNQEKEISDLTKKLEECTASGGETTEKAASEKATLEKQKNDLQDEVNSLKAKTAKANSYNNFFKYMNSIIETHNGFTGWTDAEFQEGRRIAESTGDTTFASRVNWAWYETSVDVTTRVIGVWKAIASGIETSLK